MSYRQSRQALLRKRLTPYVAARLRRERDIEGYGYLARVARETGFASGHVSKVVSGTTTVGPDFGAAVAMFWKFKNYGELLDAVAGAMEAVNAKSNVQSDSSLPAVKRTSLIDNDGLRSRVRSLVREKGVAGALRTLDVSRAVLTAFLSELPIRAGSVALLRERVARLDQQHESAHQELEAAQ